MIFVQISSLIKAIPKIIVPKATNWSAFSLRFSFWIFLLITSALLTGCGSPKHIQTQIVKEIQLDTMYLSTEKYDSIYITQDRYIDRSRDTLYTQESNTEYRYKLLRDTIKEVRVDSIPYEVRIVETKQVKYTSTWIKYLSIIGCIALTIFIKNLISKLLK